METGGSRGTHGPSLYQIESRMSKPGDRHSTRQSGVLGSAGASPAGCGALAATDSSINKFAIPRRHRQQARRLRSPEQRVAAGCYDNPLLRPLIDRYNLFPDRFTDIFAERPEE